METEIGATEAKKAYIAYIQVNDLLSELGGRRRAITSNTKEAYGFRSAASSYAKSFNTILRTAKETLKFDEYFMGSVDAIVEVEEAVSPSIPDDVLSRGAVLRGAPRAFITMYMAPEEKTRIGFHPDTE